MVKSEEPGNPERRRFPITRTQVLVCSSLLSAFIGYELLWVQVLVLSGMILAPIVACGILVWLILLVTRPGRRETRRAPPFFPLLVVMLVSFIFLGAGELRWRHERAALESFVENAIQENPGDEERVEQLLNSRSAPVFLRPRDCCAVVKWWLVADPRGQVRSFHLRFSPGTLRHEHLWLDTETLVWQLLPT